MPEFYLHIDTDQIMLGGGIWMPSSEVLFNIRDRIRQKPQQWQSLLDDPHMNSHFEAICHNSLTRPPKGFAKDLPFINHIKCRSFFALRRDRHWFLVENYQKIVAGILIRLNYRYRLASIMGRLLSTPYFIHYYR